MESNVPTLQFKSIEEQDPYAKALAGSDEISMKFQGALGCDMIDSDCLRNKSVDEVMNAQAASYVNVPFPISKLLTCLPW